MADQAAMSGNGTRTDGSTEGMVGSIAGFGNDIATLAELQARLALLDFKASAARSQVPLALIVAGSAVALASLPVALLGVADLVAEALALRTGWAMLLTAAVALVVAGAVVAGAAGRFGRGLESFRRSREELTRNLSWIRTVLLHSGRPRR
jgi:hypothetical protein